MTDTKQLLEFFNPEKFNHDEVIQILDKVITSVKEKGGEHQAGCAWIIMMLYKNGVCTTIQIEDTLDEILTYLKGYDDYKESIVIGDVNDCPLNYYNNFVHKKIKGV